MENNDDSASGADKGPLKNVVFVDPCVVTGHLGSANGTNTVFYYTSTCADAIRAMVELGSALDGVVATTFVPQGGWDMERCYEFPGLELLEQFGGQVRTLLWTHAAGVFDDEISSAADTSGVRYFDVKKDGGPGSVLQSLDKALFEEKEVA
jgi:hypothetical protein